MSWTCALECGQSRAQERDFARVRTGKRRHPSGVALDMPCKRIRRTIQMSTDDKPKDPASYFPSIEKKHGQPIAQWLALVGTLGDMKHMEMVAWLKSTHGLGHGHANAIVAHALAARSKP